MEKTINIKEMAWEEFEKLSKEDQIRLMFEENTLTELASLDDNLGEMSTINGIIDRAIQENVQIEGVKANFFERLGCKPFNELTDDEKSEVNAMWRAFGMLIQSSIG